MIVAKNIDDGDCPECGASQSLEISIINEDDLRYGYVSCIKCHVWITDLMPEELVEMGLISSRENGLIDTDNNNRQ